MARGSQISRPCLERLRGSAVSMPILHQKSRDLPTKILSHGLGRYERGCRRFHLEEIVVVCS
jgi:hypothetical protein